MKDGRLCEMQYRPSFDDIFSVSEFEYETRVEVLPPHTNRVSSFAGHNIRITAKQPPSRDATM